jgi:glycosyltransferase involved in cell wall biosynthesis
MSRPVVAIISNALTPYRLHFHRRLVREQPGIEWWSLFTHDVSNAPWALADEHEIRPVRFGQGERSDDQAKLGRAIHECRKGGRIIRWLQEHNAAAVILLGYNDFGRLRILRWCHRNQVPCFLFGDSNIRGDRTSGWKSRIKRWFLPRVLRRCAGALACGSLGRAYFRKYGVPDERIFYMPYEPDYGMIQSLDESWIRAQMHNLSVPIGPSYLLYCGRLASVKRVDLLVDAFAAIADGRPNWELLILGDGPLRESLRSRLTPPLQSRIHWLGFVNDQRVIAAVQRSAKILILPSDYEPWGVVINEGVAAGCAVVATEAVGAAAELVRDGVNGRIIPTGSLSALTQALEQVTEPATLATYRQNSAEVLAQWRKDGDPVHGLMAALRSVSIIPESASASAAGNSE